jgi:glutamyl endopeptidase
MDIRLKKEIEMTSVRRIGTFVALTMLLTGASMAAAQPQEARQNNLHNQVSNGPLPPRAEVKVDFAESFEGYGPALATAGARFDETGAVLDGAAEVNESADDVWALFDNAGTSSINSLWGGSIIGADTRTRVNPTTVYPARAIALVTFNGGFCTGWFISADTVATAGHCVHSGGTGGNWRSNVRVYPGRNGSSSPYGSCTARQLYSVDGWTKSGLETHDYGAIKLSCTVGNTVGWFGFFWQSASLTGLPTTIAGYPDDKPLTQWKSTGPVAVTQSRQIFYKNDTRPGQSGAPVYYNKAGCGQCSMAIHAYGVHGASPHSTNNHATRINDAVFNNLVAWKNAP